MLPLSNQPITKLVLLLGLFICFSTPAEENNTNKNHSATDIIDQMEKLYRGNSSQADIVMRIETPHYKRELTLKAWSMGKERSLIRIFSPRKDKGIATLKIDQEMWNFFPKINKVIKIPPSMMMGSWMGSDFTNDDLVKESSLVDDYNLSLEESAEQYIITLIPKALTVTVWGRIDYIVDKSLMIPVEQIFFDEKMDKVRIMKFLDPKDFSGRLLPSTLEITPLNKPGNKTSVTYQHIIFDPDDITEKSFSLRTLKERF